MAVKKSELYASLWKSCDELRGGMDASQYKDYVLVMLFVKYVSDKYAGQLYAPVTIPEGASFGDMVQLKGKADCGDRINKEILAPLFKANDLPTPPDFNDASKLGSGKEMVQRLSNLIAIFEDSNLDFSGNRADGDDLLGDAYEYLMRNFATESGKSKGQFYTPAEVSRVLAELIGIRQAETSESTTVYDPTCGSGSLLLKVAEAAQTGVSLYGQEKDSATSGLARMNMILHDQPTAEIKQGNTITQPHFGSETQLKTFDYVVANPPFSDKRWSTGIDPATDVYGRFGTYGIPPTRQGDYAYLLHIVRSLKTTGTAACILPHGVLFRGNAEATIRENLVKSGLIKGIIGLPANLFYGTGIPACVLVLDKSDAASRKSIFMVDASRGFIKDGNKNRLREMDIHRIVDVFTKLSGDDPSYARLVPIEELEANEFNLNIPRYIDRREEEDVQDIGAHLRGGVPERDVDALNAYWSVCPGLRDVLFDELRPGYVSLSLKPDQLNGAIQDHPEFRAFTDTLRERFGAWAREVRGRLRALEPGLNPKKLADELGDALLDAFRDAPLIDHYEVYQHFMDYWYETMRDDAYLLAADGWKAETSRVIVHDKKGRAKDKGWVCDLVPREYVIARCFANESSSLAELNAELDAASAAKQELEDEHGSVGDALESVESKSDASAARLEAFDAYWQSTNPDTYSLLDEKRRHEAQVQKRIEELAVLPALRPCLGKSQNVKITAVRRLLKKADDGSEHLPLRQYESAYEERKRLVSQIEELRKEQTVFLTSASGDDVGDGDLHDIQVIDEYLRLEKQISKIKSSIKAANAALDDKAYETYPTLDAEAVRDLVVDDKWLATLRERVDGEVGRVSRALTDRVRELAERYETSLPEAMARVDELQAKVDAHLKRMGV